MAESAWERVEPGDGEPEPTARARSWVVICSPVSGNKSGRQCVERELLPAWRRALGSGLNPAAGEACPEVFVTEHALHAGELARQHGGAGRGLVVVGGDGTISEVLEALRERGTLRHTAVAVLSQGSLNFFAVTAGLPGAAGLPDAVLRGALRPSSLMEVRDNTGCVARVSFEAFHVGEMAHRVCRAAREWRFSPGGPLAGIFKELIGCNLAPRAFSQRGTLELELVSGHSVRLEDAWYWIVASHRNPYTGVVGESMWVAAMPLAGFPGFGRMMQFFAPPMEHYAGHAYAFPCVYECDRLCFTAEGAQELGLVLDGSDYRAGARIVVTNQRRAWHVVADREPPRAVEARFTKVHSITPLAKRWLKAHPPPAGTPLHRPQHATPEQDEPLAPQLAKIAALAALVVYVVLKNLLPRNAKPRVV